MRDVNRAPPGQGLLSVVVCDTEPIAMEGLAKLLESAGGLHVAATESSLLDGMDAVRELRPSVLVLDKGFGGHALLDWITALRQSSSPPAIVVWGTSLSELEGMRFLHAGASGVVRKTSCLESVLKCIRAVAEGGTWMEDDILCEAGRRTRPTRSPLTPREAQVLELVRQGMKNKEVAFTLGIRIGTVKIHLKHIFEKTGIHGRYGLAISGLKERGLAPALVV